MKRILLLLALLALSFPVSAQTGMTYTDAASLPLYGKTAPDLGSRYRRLPPSMEKTLRAPLWRLGCNSAGLYLRFRSNAPEIQARWTNTGNKMPHMTACGIGGLDLYVLDGKKWRFIGSGFNGGEWTAVHSATLVRDMQPRMREYMLYLSLYDEVVSLELGVPAGSRLEAPARVTPAAERPVVMYGSSILQGGCASRPGMAFTNILSRRLGRTVINLGFSGNALLDEEIARLMAQTPQPSAFVLDYVPNASPAQIRDRGEAFFRILREAHPDVPVIFVEDPQFPHSLVNTAVAREIREKNEAQRALYQRLRKAGNKRLYYIRSQGMIGNDGEATVDGVHLTDLGMVRYADHIFPTLRRVVK